MRFLLCGLRGFKNDNHKKFRENYSSILFERTPPLSALVSKKVTTDTKKNFIDLTFAMYHPEAEINSNSDVPGNLQ